MSGRGGPASSLRPYGTEQQARADAANGYELPQLTMNVLRTSWDDQTVVLHDGRIDVGYVRQPFDQQGLHVQALLTNRGWPCYPSATT